MNTSLTILQLKMNYIKLNNMTVPEKWLVIVIENPEAEEPMHRVVHKVFASWDDSWKMNSGIDRIMEDDKSVDFYGYSGSRYSCDKGSYGVSTSYAQKVLDNIIKKADDRGITMRVLSEDTDWMELS